MLVVMLFLSAVNMTISSQSKWPRRVIDCTCVCLSSAYNYILIISVYALLP